MLAVPSYLQMSQFFLHCVNELKLLSCLACPYCHLCILILLNLGCYLVKERIRKANGRWRGWTAAKISGIILLLCLYLVWYGINKIYYSDFHVVFPCLWICQNSTRSTCTIFWWINYPVILEIGACCCVDEPLSTRSSPKYKFDFLKYFNVLLETCLNLHLFDFNEYMNLYFLKLKKEILKKLIVTL